MRKILLLSTALLAFGLSSCTDADQAKLTGYGNTYSIEVVSGGQVVRTYQSTGKVSGEAQSDGYFFNDRATGKLVEVSGQVIITQLD